MRSRKVFASVIAAVLIGSTGLTIASAAETKPLVSAVVMDDLVIAKATNYPANAEINWSATVEKGSGSSVAESDAKGVSVIAFELPASFTGRVTVAAVSGSVESSKSIIVGDDAESPVTTAPSSTIIKPDPVTNREPEPDTVGASDYMIVSRAELGNLSTSGMAFENMKRIADGSLGSVDLDDQDNQTAAKAVAAGLMFAKTEDVQYKAKVEALLAEVAATKPTSASRALGWGRQIAGYAIAADLVGYRTPEFVDFMSDVRTMELPGHSRWTNLKGTAEDSASNWGAWALTSYLASSLYVDDAAAIDHAVSIYKGVIGDTSAYANFRATNDYDPSWVCGSPSAAEFRGPGINAACSPELDGAIVEDIARSEGTFPSIDETGLMYSWETLSGYVQTAWLIKHAGNSDAYDWSDQALLRAGQFLAREGGWPAAYEVSYPTAVAINRMYNVDLGPLPGYGHGRQFGYTDWLTP